MKPHHIYKRRKSTTAGWTRVDMLLALYDAAIDALEQARLARQQDDHLKATSQQLRANQLVLAIASGLDPDAVSEDTAAGNVRRLALFVLERIAAGRIEPALRVLNSLRDGYEQIREEARDLERRGAIPPLGKRTVPLCEA